MAAPFPSPSPFYRSTVVDYGATEAATLVHTGAGTEGSLLQFPCYTRQAEPALHAGMPRAVLKDDVSCTNGRNGERGRQDGLVWLGIDEDGSREPVVNPAAMAEKYISAHPADWVPADVLQSILEEERTLKVAAAASRSTLLRHTDMTLDTLLRYERQGNKAFAVEAACGGTVAVTTSTEDGSLRAVKFRVDGEGGTELLEDKTITVGLNWAVDQLVTSLPRAASLGASISGFPLVAARSGAQVAVCKVGGALEELVEDEGGFSGVEILELSALPTDICVSPYGPEVGMVTDDGCVHLWDAGESRVVDIPSAVGMFDDDTWPCLFLAYSAHPQVLIVGETTTGLYRVDAREGPRRRWTHIAGGGATMKMTARELRKDNTRRCLFTALCTGASGTLGFGPAPGNARAYDIVCATDLTVQLYDERFMKAPTVSWSHQMGSDPPRHLELIGGSTPSIMATSWRAGRTVVLQYGCEASGDMFGGLDDAAPDVAEVPMHLPPRVDARTFAIPPMAMGSASIIPSYQQVAPRHPLTQRHSMLRGVATARHGPNALRLEFTDCGGMYVQLLGRSPQPQRTEPRREDPVLDESVIVDFDRTREIKSYTVCRLPRSLASIEVERERRGSVTRRMSLDMEMAKASAPGLSLYNTPMQIIQRELLLGRRKRADDGLVDDGEPEKYTQVCEGENPTEVMLTPYTGIKQVLAPLTTATKSRRSLFSGRRSTQTDAAEKKPISKDSTGAELLRALDTAWDQRSSSFLASFARGETRSAAVVTPVRTVDASLPLIPRPALSPRAKPAPSPRVPPAGTAEMPVSASPLAVPSRDSPARANSTQTAHNAPSASPSASPARVARSSPQLANRVRSMTPAQLKALTPMQRMAMAKQLKRRKTEGF